MRGLFTQERVAASGNVFLDGLLGDERHKTGWMRAEAAGDPGPWRQQAILGRGRWDADALRDIVRDDVVEHLATPKGVLVIDETGFLKQGKPLSIVPSICLRAGRATQRGLLAHVPETVAFATKPALAIDMIQRALTADVPFSWVAADAVYGVGDIESAPRRAGKGYVLGVKSDHHFGSWAGKPPVAGTAEEIARDIAPDAWQRLSAGEGTKGARLHDWIYCELADLDAEDYDEMRTGLWTRGLLIRRNIRDGDLAFFTTWCPAGTGIQTLVSIEGHRWAIEDSFETAMNELGLDHNETRSWHGWHRRVSLVMLAFAMMAVVRYRANNTMPLKRPRMPTIRN